MFDAHTGNVKPQIVAKMMWKVYDQINNPPKKIDWYYGELVDMLPEENFIIDKEWRGLFNLDNE